MLARASNPAAPETVTVSRPSDAFASRLLVADSITSLLLGLGAVALLIGGVGIANMMVISVLERRTEIGLRCALGAARRHIAPPQPHRRAPNLMRRWRRLGGLARLAPRQATKPGSVAEKQLG